MAQAAEPVVPAKRGVGRPRRDATHPPAKKAKVSLPAKEATPIVTDSPVPQSTPKSGLPAKLSAAAPLPTLPQPQPADLPDSEYQSLASSAVLAASLERSRQAWTHDGIFERFWTKPEGKVKGVDPLIKAMKSRGRCRLRIEPHIFEVEVWVVERPKPAPPPPIPKQPQVAASYGSAYRPQASSSYSTPQQHTPYYQSRPPVGQQPTPSRVHSPANIQPIPPAVQQRPLPTQPTLPPARAPEKKQSPDPVISMLATRASSDPELKALMKEVATGKATQDQLRVFQKHIDELTAMIQSRKQREESGTSTPQPTVPQYDGAGDEPPPLTRPYIHQQTSYTTPRQPQLQTYTPPQPPEVVFAFTAPGATEDRFLFPRHSILEPLSQQHVLASFIITRHAADPFSFEPASSRTPSTTTTEFWQPVTLMVEVAYGRENILKDVSRWVKPAEEVREEMKRVMARCTRAPEAHLALRLPHKSAVVGSEEVSKAGTPVVEVERKVVKAKRAKGKEKEKVGDDGTAAPKASTVEKEAQEEAGAAAPKDDAQEVKEEKDEGSGRPKRITRKSVRISEI